MNPDDLLQSALAGALIVVSGGLYALLLALGRLRDCKRLARAAAVAYLMLVVCVVLLADGLGLGQGWYIVIGIMLAGYGLAPKAIWHLTEATHRGERQ